MARRALVGLGSNLGSRRAWLRLALHGLQRLSEAPLRRSALHRSEPMGPPQRSYLNAVVALRWSGSPEALLEALLELERRLLRRRRLRWGPRTVDLDLLWMEGVSRCSPSLTLPHPGIFSRPFVVLPALQVAPPVLAPALRKAAENIAPGARSSRTRWRPPPRARCTTADDPGEALIELLEGASRRGLGASWSPERCERIQAADPLQCLAAARRHHARLLAMAPAGAGGWEALLGPGRLPAFRQLELRRREAGLWQARWRATSTSKL